eukprot:jgi/Ulvmu1/2819/UM142_0017.1
MLGCNHVSSRGRVAPSRLLSNVRMGTPRAVAVKAFSPPTVETTKTNFLKLYDTPIPAMYETVLQELLVQQHFMRYNISYKYDPVFALGIVSIFDQVLDDMDEDKRDAIFKAYIESLDEKPQQYRDDADKLAELAEACSSADDLIPDADGSELQKILASVASRAAAKEFFYTRFFAIGVFRLLELTDTRDPKALEGVVKALGVSQDSVNKDLLLYKSILSKMAAAKELMKEFLEREKRKQAEREAGKAVKGESEAPAAAEPEKEKASA